MYYPAIFMVLTVEAKEGSHQLIHWYVKEVKQCLLRRLHFFVPATLQNLLWRTWASP